MIKPVYLSVVMLILIQAMSKAQGVLTPDEFYGDLFRKVQVEKIFPDGKTFVDAIPRRKPLNIMYDYNMIKDTLKDLKSFVLQNFIIPPPPPVNNIAQEKDVNLHIKNLWKQLARKNDSLPAEGNSVLQLPYTYIVPGGRFREIYYWDSYFTMLGLQEHGEKGLVENMINNFAFLINQYGHVPNGNRTYYLSRSQPPFFSMMVELLAEMSGNSAYAIYLSALEKEYDYWMDKSAPTKHVVKMPDGSTLNRYYDQLDIPRQESWAEDDTLTKTVPEQRRQKMNRDLRSAAESGWDFSSRWFADGKSISTIQTTDVIPVDLNCYLYNLETVLARAYKMRGDLMKERYLSQIAERRKAAINKYCWSTISGWYADYLINKKVVSTNVTLAGVAPLFCHVAPQARVRTIAYTLSRKFLKDGGLVTSLKNSGQQWDAPNGWAPLQWMAVKGLRNYGESDLAEAIARRWISLNINVYNNTGKLMEKYDVIDTTKPAGGGEYPGQDGFGWTNGVLVKLMGMYPEIATK